MVRFAAFDIFGPESVLGWVALGLGLLSWVVGTIFLRRGERLGSTAGYLACGMLVAYVLMAWVALPRIDADMVGRNFASNFHNVQVHNTRTEKVYFDKNTTAAGRTLGDLAPDHYTHYIVEATVDGKDTTCEFSQRALSDVEGSCNPGKPRQK